jgi:hypothetical protein
VSWLVAMGVIAALVALHRVKTRGLVRVSVRDGAVQQVTGRLPAQARNDLADALRGSGASGTIILLDVGRDTGVVECPASLDPAAAQRVRNVLGNLPVARLRGA